MSASLTGLRDPQMRLLPRQRVSLARSRVLAGWLQTDVPRPTARRESVMGRAFSPPPIPLPAHLPLSNASILPCCPRLLLLYLHLSFYRISHREKRTKAPVWIPWLLPSCLMYWLPGFRNVYFLKMLLRRFLLFSKLDSHLEHGLGPHHSYIPMM